MRRINDDDGAVVLLFGVLSIFLFVAVALVANVGRSFYERRELQNGADAAAIAVAFDCARAVANPLTVANCTEPVAITNVAGLANANATFDGASTVDDVDINLLGGKVTVDTLSAEGGEDSIELTLNRDDDDLDRKTVVASATAAWGAASTAEGLPIVIPKCAFDTLGAPALRFPESGPFPNASPWTAPPHPTWIVLNQAQPPMCPDAPDHPPGSHGWLDGDSPGGACTVFLAVGQTSLGTAAGKDPACDIFSGIPAAPAQAEAFKNHIFNTNNGVWKVPIIEEGVGGGGWASYEVAGWAAMKVTGWYFSNTFKYPPSVSGCGLGPGSSAICIRGWFVNQAPGSGPIIPGNSFGVQSVQLIK